MTPIIQSLDRFPTRAALLQTLGEGESPFHVLGSETENAREFFLCRLLFPEFGRVDVAIVSMGMALRPHCLVKGDRVFVACNNRVAVLWTHFDLEVRQVPLWTPCAELLEVPSLRPVIVVGESAVVAISEEGRELWRRDTDHITDYRLEGTRLHLTFHDDPPTTLDLASGNPG